MEDQKSNEESPNKSTLSDDDKPPSPKITLFEKHEVVRLENKKPKEKHESNIQPDLTKEQREATDGPLDLAKQHRLSKKDSSEDLQKESKENISPSSYAATDLSKDQAEAVDSQETEKHSNSPKNLMDGEFSNGKHLYKNGQEGNAQANLDKGQTEAMDKNAEEPDPQLHIQNDPEKGNLQTGESSEVNRHGSSSDLNKEQTGVMGRDAEEPKPQLHIQNDPVKGELTTEDSLDINEQEIESSADMKEKQKDDFDYILRKPEGNSQGQENNLKELPVTKSISDRNNGSKYDDGNGLSLKKNYRINTISNLTECQPETAESFNLILKQRYDQRDSVKELFVERPLRNDEVIDSFPDLEIVQFEEDDDFKAFQKQFSSESSKFVPPVNSIPTGCTSKKKNAICSCSQLTKKEHPNACQTKFSIMREDSILSLNCLQPIGEHPPDLLWKDSVETAAQYTDFFTDESDDEIDSQPVILTGFSKEFCEQLFSQLNKSGASSETGDSTANEPLFLESPSSVAPRKSDAQWETDSPCCEPLHLESPSSEATRPLFPVSTVLAELIKERKAHNQSQDFEEVLRIRDLFRNYPDYPFGSPNPARDHLLSSSDGPYALSEYGRYVRLSPTDVVCQKSSHVKFLSSFSDWLRRYSSSIKRDDGPFGVRFVRNFASSALQTFATFAEGMKEKIEDDIEYYKDIYIIEPMGSESSNQ